jgi:hypothetical protein
MKTFLAPFGRAVVYSLVFWSIYLCSSISQASSPLGAPPVDAAEAFSKSDVVFLANIESVTNDKWGSPSLANVRVDKVWKGRESLSALAKVDGSGGPTYPARLFEVGHTYLFYLPTKAKDGMFRADSYLHRVLTGKEVEEDLKYLSRFRAHKIK